MGWGSKPRPAPVGCRALSGGLAGQLAAALTPCTPPNGKAGLLVLIWGQKRHCRLEFCSVGWKVVGEKSTRNFHKRF